MQPLVSVVIPTYNSSNVLERAINSVLVQTYEKLELIIVDDGSTDETLDYSELSLDPRIRVIRRDRNYGAAAARNVGIRAGRGDYIAFLDADDEWLPSKLERQVEVVPREFYNSALVYCRSEIRTPHRRQVLPDEPIDICQDISDYLFVKRGFMPTPSILVSRRVAEVVEFNESLPRHQDFDFLLRVHDQVKYFFVPEVLVIIHWEKSEGPIEKGWTPELSKRFAEDYKEYLSDAAYWNFLFINRVIHVLRHYGLTHSIRNLLTINMKKVSIDNWKRFLFALMTHPPRMMIQRWQ